MSHYVLVVKEQPTCPKCSGEMQLRKPHQGDAWLPFWGCKRWPDCDGKKPASFKDEAQLGFWEDIREFEHVLVHTGA